MGRRRGSGRALGPWLRRRLGRRLGRRLDRRLRRRVGWAGGRLLPPDAGAQRMLLSNKPVDGPHAPVLRGLPQAAAHKLLRREVSTAGGAAGCRCC